MFMTGLELQYYYKVHILLNFLASDTIWIQVNTCMKIKSSSQNLSNFEYF